MTTHNNLSYNPAAATRRIIVSDIVYDTDGDEEIAKDLPKTLTFDVRPDFDIDNIADLVSDETGWLVKSLNTEEVMVL